MGAHSRRLTPMADGSMVASVGGSHDRSLTAPHQIGAIVPWILDCSDDDLRGLPLRWVYIDDDPFPVLERLPQCE